jgi:hypothetical protein
MSKCCCGFEPPKPKPKVNNLRTANAQYCCGMVELGNFNYIDPPDGKKMTHFHKVGSGWSVQENAEPTTREDIEKALQNTFAACIVCTTGAGQEYLEPTLAEVGFKHVFTFKNPGHANTDVKLWVKSKTPSDAP